MTIHNEWTKLWEDYETIRAKLPRWYRWGMVVVYLFDHHHNHYSTNTKE